jgi:hypothetical protein
LKQWLAMLTRNYPEAVELFTVRVARPSRIRSRVCWLRSLKPPEKNLKILS